MKRLLIIICFFPLCFGMQKQELTHSEMPGSNYKTSTTLYSIDLELKDLKPLLVYWIAQNLINFVPPYRENYKEAAPIDILIQTLIDLAAERTIPWLTEKAFTHIVGPLDEPAPPQNTPLKFTRLFIQKLLKKVLTNVCAGGQEAIILNYTINTLADHISNDIVRKITKKKIFKIPPINIKTCTYLHDFLYNQRV